MVENSSTKPEVSGLVDEFVKWALEHEELHAADKFRSSRAAYKKMYKVVKQLETIDPPGRLALVPLLEHPDAAIRAHAGTYLCRIMPDRILPMLRKLADANTKEALSLPHALSAASTADNTIWFYEHGELSV